MAASGSALRQLIAARQASVCVCGVLRMYVRSTEYLRSTLPLGCRSRVHVLVRRARASDRKVRCGAVECSQAGRQAGSHWLAGRQDGRGRSLTDRQAGRQAGCERVAYMRGARGEKERAHRLGPTLPMEIHTHVLRMYLNALYSVHALGPHMPRTSDAECSAGGAASGCVDVRSGVPALPCPVWAAGQQPGSTIHVRSTQ